MITVNEDAPGGQIRGAISIDTETYLISAGNLAPKLVCISMAEDTNHADVVHVNDPMCKQIVFELLSGRYPLVGQNIAFDFGVLCNQWPDLLPLVFKAYDDERVFDTMIRQKLIDIANGVYRKEFNVPTGVWVKHFYNLGELAERFNYPIPLDKDTWRLRYSELYHLPVESWPRDAVEYPEHDAKSTLWVAQRQEHGNGEVLVDQHRQVRAAWALHLVSAWGMRTDKVMVDRLRAETEAKILKCEQILEEKGFVYRDKHGAIRKRTKVVQEYAKTINPTAPTTPTGKPQLDEDAISHYGGDKFLEAFQLLSSAGTVTSRIKELEGGLIHPIQTRFDIVETGRVSSDKPNMMNRPVKPGDRECVVARKGRCIVDIDYDGLELRTWAQICIWVLGYSDLAQVLNKGGDPHSMIAAQLLGIPLEEMLKRKKDKDDKIAYNGRQTGKVANFGLPGGIGASTLRAQARKKYEVTLDPVITEYRQTKRGPRPVLPQTEAVIQLWKDTWSEAPAYLNWVQNLTAGHDPVSITHYGSYRKRGGVRFTEAANSFFQALGADAAKDALYALVKECYIGTGILNGSRPINFIHDQVLVEVPEEGARECAKEVQRIWIAQANEWLPDVPATADPVLCRRWSKLAGDSKTGVIDVNGIWEWNEAIKAGSLGYAT